MTKGISRLAALEIFVHPTDLIVFINKDGESGKYRLGIHRGLDYGGKPLVSIPDIKNFDNGIEEIKKTLEFILKTGKRHFGKIEGINQSKTLNPVLVNKIIEELKKNQIANTAKL